MISLFFYLEIKVFKAHLESYTNIILMKKFIFDHPTIA